MLELVPKIIAYNMFKRFNFPKVLPIFLTISVNDWCNSMCKTCNIWMNKSYEKIKEELKLDEFQKIFKNYGKTYWITITGGEPFLRNDLVEVVKTIYDNTYPKIMTIATNGTIPERIVSWTSQILESCRRLKLIINTSLDGIGEQHDEIRGFKKNYERVVETINGLKSLNNPRLIVGINSVISMFNVSNFSKIYYHIIQNLKPDSYIAEVAENRAKLYNMGIKITPEYDEYKNALIFLIKEFKNQNKSDIPDIIRNLRIEFYRYLIFNYPMEIFEGIASCYIMSNGEVWLSYSMPFIAGNLREVNYDFKKIWFNNKANEFRKIMKNGYSTMVANSFYTNFVCNLNKIMGLWLKNMINSLFK
jgi:MoaA/NifB/PqqE/SkfB family radical SAM enzyme